MKTPFRIRCSSVEYRQGLFEVTAGIHRRRVNVEAWTIDPGYTLPESDQMWDALPDEAVSGNTEIELTSAEARRLAAAILEAAEAAEAADRATSFELDGSRFNTLEEFYAEVSRVLIPGAEWGHDLDAFNDILRGGFGTPEGGFLIRWKNHELSRERLGYPETVRQLERRLARCHPQGRDGVARDLESARRGEGATAFDWLVEIVRDHGPAGEQHEDNVELDLQ